MHHDHKNNSKFADICLQCHICCLDTFYNHCLKMGGKHVEPEHLRLMADCIQICQTCADFMTRNSHYHNLICNVCAVICNACADSCEKIGGAEMKKCAEICRKCATSCKEVGVIEQTGTATYS